MMREIAIISPIVAFAFLIKYWFITPSVTGFCWSILAMFIASVIVGIFYEDGNDRV